MWKKVNLKNKLSALISVLLFIILLVLYIHFNKDAVLQRKLTTLLINHRTDDVMSIDLKEILGTGWNKVCVQTPYMFQEDFEKRVGEHADNFQMISDDRYAIWVFYSNGDVSHAEVEMGKVMSYARQGSRCTSSKHPYLYFKIIDGKKEYFFNEI